MKLRVLFTMILAAAFALAQPAPPTAPANQPPPDESILGTVPVSGAAGDAWGGPPPPKMAVVPVISQNAHDNLLTLVVRRDLELSGQFEVLDPQTSPARPFQRDTPIEYKEWEPSGAEYILRVYATPKGDKVELYAEAYLVPPKEKGKDAGAEPPPKAEPAYKKKLDAGKDEVRAASHRLVDDILGGLTGRPGGFASQMTYSGRVGRWNQVFVLDADGHNMRAMSPGNGTILTPAFGPGNEVYYAYSESFRRFKIVHGKDAKPLAMDIPGSVLGLAFSQDRSRLAYAVMENGIGTVFLADPIGSVPKQISQDKLAHYPAFSPTGKIAYTAGFGIQRVYVDGKAISPPGFYASSPAFCESEKGLLVIFTVGVGAGADLISVDTSGGGIRRLTQRMGSNQYAACSPDGRLVAFFSSQRTGQGPGLYMLPIARPWLVKKISNEVGESLRWEPLVPPPPKK
jgi:TolB protein